VKPVLLDLFCGAGGAAMGYHRAGWEVVGVDLAPQPHFPFEFIQGDWQDPLWVLRGLWERQGRPYAIHASPPCQHYSAMRRGRWQDRQHPDLIAPVREHLLEIGAPFVIENVVAARDQLQQPVMLCGTMFGLGADGYTLRRHRLFETHGFSVWAPAGCNHVGPALPVYGHSGGRSTRDGLTFPGIATWRAGMDIDWMNGHELAESIPPAFTHHIGMALREAVDDTGWWEGVLA
jgi:DNA (cytosine-5)-methyltransferase 1